MRAWVNQYQNVFILDLIGAKGDGGGRDNWSYNMCKAPVIMSPPTNQHPVFYRPDALPVARQQCQSTDGPLMVHTHSHLPHLLLHKFIPISTLSLQKLTVL